MKELNISSTPRMPIGLNNLRNWSKHITLIACLMLLEEEISQKNSLKTCLQTLNATFMELSQAASYQSVQPAFWADWKLKVSFYSHGGIVYLKKSNKKSRRIIQNISRTNCWHQHSKNSRCRKSVKPSNAQWRMPQVGRCCSNSTDLWYMINYWITVNM